MVRIHDLKRGAHAICPIASERLDFTRKLEKACARRRMQRLERMAHGVALDHAAVAITVLVARRPHWRFS
jgi:hypothetical protein